MPSAPRSKACQPCKARRVKCDQAWPICTACRLRGIICPGPSELIKFVNFNTKSSNPEIRTTFEDGPVADHKPQESRGVALQQTGRKKIKFLAASRKEDQAYYYTFRLNPALSGPNLTTSAERVSARLVSHLKSSSTQGMLTLMAYLQDLPQHMNENPSLRDSVDLFCTAWTGHRRGHDADRFLDMPAYGKAIRSLRRTLQSDKAVTLQTLASIVILGRAEEFFDPGHKPDLTTHKRGLANMVVQLGAPRPGDYLHNLLMVESFGILLPYFLMTGETNFMNSDPWGKIIKNCIVDMTKGRHLLPPLTVHCLMGERMPKILHECPELRRDPYDPQTFPLAMLTIAELQQLDEVADKSLPAAIQDCVATNQMIEKPDPDSIAGTSYDFTNVFVPRVLVSLCYMKLTVLRMRYDWSDVYQLPDKVGLYNKTRALCVHVWKYIPYLLRLETFIASIFHFVFYPTLEFATKSEEEYLLDFFAETDRFQHRLPADRDALKEAILYQAKLATGRLPISQSPKTGSA